MSKPLEIVNVTEDSDNSKISVELNFYNNSNTTYITYKFDLADSDYISYKKDPSCLQSLLEAIILPDE